LYYILKTFYKLVQLLIKAKPVCTLSFITSANFWTGITCNITHMPYVVSERTSPDRSINRFNYVHRYFMAWLYKKADAVVVSAKGVEDCLRKNKAFKKLPNICRITNAVPSFKAASATKVHHRKFILGVGRLAYVKGFDRLIEAFSLCRLTDVDLLIVGDGDEREALTNQINKLGLKNKVFMPGAKTNLQDYYSQAQLFVLPSRNEGYPNALVEAMSFGCPCVAMDCEFGPSEIITNDHNGILVPANNVAALSNAMVRMFKAPMLQKKIVQNALNINKTNHPDEIFRQWEHLILKF
jgi:glycosyltransferase involved in cell wall biosynthesis